jgi:iron complex transport system substrate-binding protein
MRKSTIWLTLGALILLLPACAPPPSPTPPAVLQPQATQANTETAPSASASQYPLTITDDAGRSVTLESRPDSIVSLAPSNTEILYALGLGDSVAGVTEFCNYPPEALEKPQVGGFSDIDIETIAVLDPDLVLAANLHITDVVPALEALGMTVVVIDPLDFPAVLEGIALVAEITGQQAAGQVLLEDMQIRADALASALAGREPRRAFWELDSDLWTAGPGSFVDDLITRAGGENIAADADSPWVQLSNETIIAADPEVVFLADYLFGETQASVAERPGWDQLSAVRNDAVIEVTDTDIFSRPGPRVVDALEFAARSLHPEAFE